MAWRNTVHRYGCFGQTLHWLVVMGIIAAYIAAETGDGDALMPLHRSIGITILALAVLRLGWRLANRTPELPSSMAAWQRGAARAAHALLYVLLFLVPLTGWLLSSAEGGAITVFGRLELPALPSTTDAETLEEFHETLFNALVAVAVLHAAAALKHHFWDRDGVLRSMLPARRDG